VTEVKKGRFAWMAVLLASLLAVAFIMAIYPGKTTFAGSHTVYKARNSTSYGDAQFCWKCHADQVVNITSSASYKAHNSTTCICHGYYPNHTAVPGPYGIFAPKVINLDHNLTMDIYCTNCHTGYNETGGLPIYGDGNLLNLENQSAHYIYFNGSDASSVEETYNRSWRYFNESFGAP
jgi:predicted nucleic-acid-binding Zn-ribbon protein